MKEKCNDIKNMTACMSQEEDTTHTATLSLRGKQTNTEWAWWIQGFTSQKKQTHDVQIYLKLLLGTATRQENGILLFCLMGGSLSVHFDILGNRQTQRNCTYILFQTSFANHKTLPEQPKCFLFVRFQA